MWTKTTEFACDQRCNGQTQASRPSLSSEHTSESSSIRTTTCDLSTPITPPRGRPTARYPESLGRVPLHRRGTSRTYERLEDLLREAGYKETRVFTPETECVAGPSEKHESSVRGTIRGGLGAVVGFFTGLVSRNPSPSRDLATAGDTTVSFSRQSASASHARFTPPSPSSHAQQLDRSINVSSSISESGYLRNVSSDNLHVTGQRMRVSSAIESAELANLPPPTKAQRVAQSHQSSWGLPHHPHLHLPSEPRHLLRRHPSKLNGSNVSTAHAYLRHMASAPNIQPLTKRPSSSEMSMRSHQQHLRPPHQYRRGIPRPSHVADQNDRVPAPECAYKPDANDQDTHAPFPRWLESVTRAILSGTSAVASDTASAKTIVTQKTSLAISNRSSLQHRGRQPVRKPSLLSPEVLDQKARACEGRVHCANVMCRSAPTSRAGSLVRAGVTDAYASTLSHKLVRSGGEHSASRGRRAKGKSRERDVLPTLAKTRVENDEWGTRHRYLGGWGMDTREDGLSSEEEDDDEDDEGELGLARLLVPARRQHSIQSLRKHLQPPTRDTGASAALGASSNGRAGSFDVANAAQRNRRDRQNGSWGASRSHLWTSGEDDGEEGYEYVFSTTNRGNSKRRRGLPGPWAQWGTS